MKKLKRILIIFIIILLIAIISYTTYSYISIENTNKYNTENISKKTENTNITKEDVFLLIDKGLQENHYVKTFIYSREFLENDSLVPIFFDGEYKETIDYIDLNKYKEPEFKFITLANTEEYVWGYFEQNEKTYIIIDKLSGKIKTLNNNSIQVVVY